MSASKQTAFEKAAAFLYAWFEQSDATDVDVDSMSAFADFLKTGLKPVSANLTKVLKSLDRILIKEGYKDGSDDLVQDVLRYMLQVCQNGGGNLADWVTVIAAANSIFVKSGACMTIITFLEDQQIPFCFAARALLAGLRPVC